MNVYLAWTREEILKSQLLHIANLFLYIDKQFLVRNYNCGNICNKNIILLILWQWHLYMNWCTMNMCTLYWMSIIDVKLKSRLNYGSTQLNFILTAQKIFFFLWFETKYYFAQIFMYFKIHVWLFHYNSINVDQQQLLDVIRQEHTQLCWWHLFHWWL